MKRLMMKTIIDYQNDEREKVLLDVRASRNSRRKHIPEQKLVLGGTD